MKYTYRKPIRINKVLEMIRDTIIELLQTKNDRHFFTDNYKIWKEQKTDLINRSTDKQDMELMTKQDVEKLARDLIQISLYGRILNTDDEGNVINMPKDELPYYMKQSIGEKYKDLYNINSQQVFMKIDERKKKLKNRNLNWIRKVRKSISPTR